ncbi:mitochondrial Rho GTPase 2 isoform X3 [Raphanus sativus]|uniref:Mitochondrial Rho GTPase n=1 Tax=Raphanus sativus TaxID=3726 RepID=A0A9W3DNE3_RAPSA|nr:mitochondrial Rho GTPase 2 isoform X3 [Raphanus sativus]
MLGGFGGKSSSGGGRKSLRVAVAGDKGTGKSSLISAVASETFPDNVPRVLPPTTLPADAYPDYIPITIIDTPSRIKLIEEFRKADVVILTYACDQPPTLDRLSSYWLPELRRLQIKAPVIVVGCKLDLRDERSPVKLEDIMAPIMKEYREIETCIECSALTLIQAPDVFYYALKAVLHPTFPLFDQEKQCLKPRLRRAVQRIFNFCDQDLDGVLNDAELNDFQVNCFGAPLDPVELMGVKRVVQERQPDGVTDLGLTLPGFLFLFSLFIERGRPETAWAILRKFGYNDSLELNTELLPLPAKHSPDQSIELTNETMDFLRGFFQLYDLDNDGALRPDELDDLFKTAPDSPWLEAPYKDAAEKTPSGKLTINGFLSEWALMTLLDPRKTLANLIYVGYGHDPASTFSVTRKRSVDRKKQRTERNVFQCFVFGPKKSGKSAILDSFIGRKFSDSYKATVGERYVANVVDQPGGCKKTLILREIPEDRVKKFLANKEALAACDVAVVVYDSSDVYSWRKAREMLMEVARKGEESGYGTPCVLVAAKDDLDAYPMSVQESDRVCMELGIDIPVSVSMKDDERNSLFRKIVSTAENPHMSVPETESGRRSKNIRQVVNSSLLFVSVGTALGFAGLAAYRAYSARKNA